LGQIASSVCPTYVAELAPAHLRGNITGLFQVMVVIGVGELFAVGPLAFGPAES
jgi:hypothetical protein